MQYAVNGGKKRNISEIRSLPEPDEKQPRDYQAETVKKFKAWLQKQSSEALIAYATGLGKTYVATLCLEAVEEKLGRKPRILWLTHTNELVIQTRKTLEKHFQEFVDVEKAGEYYNDSRICIASIQTLANPDRLQEFAKKFQPDYIVCDEAHHAMARTWGDVKRAFPNVRILNLTATPYRADTQGPLDLGEVIDKISTSEGIARGYLCKMVQGDKIKVNLGEVERANGDYVVDGLSSAMCSPSVLKATVSLIKENIQSRKALIFASSVAHGKALTTALEKEGIITKQIYADTPIEERKQIYKALENGEINAIVNKNVLKEGFDLPCINMVVVARPTVNLATYTQTIGRGIRIDDKNPDKDCLIISWDDTSRHTGKKEDTILPSTLDAQVIGETYDIAKKPAIAFLQWFFRIDEIEKVKNEQLHEYNCTHFRTPETLLATLTNHIKDEKQKNEIAKRIQNIFDPDSTVDGMKELLEITKTNNPEGFINYMKHQGWACFS